LKEWKIGDISVFVELGHLDDININLAVVAKGISLSTGNSNVTIQERTNASNIEYWPIVALDDPDRRSTIYKAATNALTKAQNISASKVGFYTTGLEAARIPSWEIAEELVRAVLKHSKSASCIRDIIFVVSSPTQVSSFQFALNNSILYLSEE
jgi:hypothetical protein